jgi:ATP-binding cassette, subfamily B, bacterial
LTAVSPKGFNRLLNTVLRIEFRPYRRSLAFASALSATAALFEVAIVYLIATLGTAVLSGSERAVTLALGLTATRRQLALTILIAIVLRGVLDLVNVQVQQRAQMRYEHRNRTGLLRGFLAARWDVQQAQESTDVHNAINTFLYQAKFAFQQVITTVNAGVSFTVMLAGSLAIGGLSVFLIIGSTVVLAIAFRPLVRSAHRAGSATRAAQRGFTRSMIETISMAREIRVFGIDEQIEERNERASFALASANKQAGLASSRLSSVYSTAVYLVAGVGLALVTYLNLANPAEFVAVVLLLYRGLNYGRGLQSGYQSLVGAMPAIEALQEKRAEFAEGRMVGGTEAFEGPLVEVRLEGVGYRYGETPALDGVDLVIRHGDSIGVVGPSGSGKSTLVQLLLGLRSPTEGRITVNDEDLARIDPHSWFGHSVLVPQEANLFNDTVLANVICFRPDITEQAATQALRDAHVLDDLLNLPDGLDTVVGEAGGRLSGGQRQRLCIARALAGAPEVLILDEPTSALDLISEEGIRATLESLRGKITLIVIAHRLSTLRSCDQVVVLKDGSIEAIGDRSELEADSDFFAEVMRLSRLA